MSGLTIPQDVVDGLVARGIPQPVAIGMAAGVAAESNGGDHTAVNPKSGAVGLGQWLGPRRENLLGAYGNKLPNRDQQIDYLAWEAKGGDPGMSSVMGAQDPQSAMKLYLRNGMRPGAGLVGDLNRATVALTNYHSGPSAQPKGGDPFDPAGDASSANPPASVNPHADDPFDPNAHPVGADSQANLPGNSVPGNAAGRQLLGNQQGSGSGQAGAPSGGLQQDSLGADLHGAAQTFIKTGNAAVNGFTAGLIKPFNAALDTIIPNTVNGQRTATIWDHPNLTDLVLGNDDKGGFLSSFHKNLALERGQADSFAQQHPIANGVADLTGAMASPANKLFAPAEGAGFLRSVPNFMAQGAVYGGVRGGADTGTLEGAAKGAGIGAAVAPAGAAVANVGGKLLGAALKARSTLASLIPQSLKQQVAGMIDHGASADDIVAAIPEAKDIAHIPDWVNYRAAGGKKPVAFGEPPPAPADEAPIVVTGHRMANDNRPTPQDYAAALGTQGSRRGIESVPDLPANVKADVQRLTAAGVSPEEALREADILHVGGKPTVAAVTRDPAEQWSFNEGAKDTSSPTGQALNQTQAGNNQVLHDTLINTVENYGGVPAQGEPIQAAAEALAKASDAGKAKVSGLYTAARAADGDVKVNTDQLRELLQTPEMATPTNPQVAQLVNGLTAHLKAVDQRAGTTLRTPDQMEDIRQLANSAYDPMGAPVNSAVSKIGKALDDGLDQLDQASAAYKAARGAHRDWASQYADPQGVQRLIARDAHGNFLNADNWRKAENGAISTIADKPFIQTVTQLQKIGATDALDKLKASVVQQAYERATNSARDAQGNPVLNGKLFQQELNKIGMPKLKALFSTDEIAHLATVGRAARHLNEPVPGTVNTSNTGVAVSRSSLAKALQAKPGKHPAISLLKGGLAVAGHVPAAVGVHAAEAVSKRTAANAVEQGVREQLNPGLARAMASRSVIRLENAQQRAAIGRALRNRGASAAADPENRRAF